MKQTRNDTILKFKLTWRSAGCERYDRAPPGRADAAGIGSECSDRAVHHALDPSGKFLHPANF